MALPIQHQHRPPITCTKFVAGSGGRCAYYLANGACVRPDEFMCVEWLKRNALSPSAPLPVRDALANLHAMRARLTGLPGGGR